MTIENLELDNLILSNEPTFKKDVLFLDEKYDQLKQCQKRIFSTTDISPSIRKIVNELISEENLKNIEKKFLVNFSAENHK